MPASLVRAALVAVVALAPAPALANHVDVDLAVTPLANLVPANRTGVTIHEGNFDAAASGHQRPIFNPIGHGHIDPAIDPAAVGVCIHLPAGFKAGTGYPVVILLHGGHQDCQPTLEWLDGEADSGVVYIAPKAGHSPSYAGFLPDDIMWDTNNGIDATKQNMGCNGRTDPRCWEDLARILALKSTLLAVNGAKLNGQFYLAGFSSGGILATEVMCYAADAFDGYGMIEGAPQWYSFPTCGQSYGRAGVPGWPFPLLPAMGTPERRLADTFLAGTGRYPVRFGVNAPMVIDPAKLTFAYVRPIVFLNASQDEKVMNGLPVSPAGVENDTGPMANQYKPLVAGQSDVQSFIEWLGGRLALPAPYQTTYDLLELGNPCAAAAVVPAGSCTGIANTTGDSSALRNANEGGQYFDMTTARFDLASTGPHTALGSPALRYVQSRGGTHMVPSTDPSGLSGWVTYFSAVEEMAAFFEAEAGLVRGP